MIQYGIYRHGFNRWLENEVDTFKQRKKIVYEGDANLLNINDNFLVESRRTKRGFVSIIMIKRATNTISRRLQLICKEKHGEFIINRHNDGKYNVELFSVRHLRGYAVVLERQENFQPSSFNLPGNIDVVTSNLQQMIDSCVAAGMSANTINKIVEDKLKSNKRMYESVDTFTTEEDLKPNYGKFLVCFRNIYHLMVLY